MLAAHNLRPRRFCDGTSLRQYLPVVDAFDPLGQSEISTRSQRSAIRFSESTATVGSQMASLVMELVRWALAGSWTICLKRSVARPFLMTHGRQLTTRAGLGTEKTLLHVQGSQRNR